MDSAEFFFIFLTQCMAHSITFLGGAEEIGANSCFLDIDGTGMFIDAGLHPRMKVKRTFPAVEAITHTNTDYALLTHAHNDHVGGLPYLLKFHPHLKLMATRATRDVMSITLPNTAKILRSAPPVDVLAADLEHYQSKTVREIVSLVEGVEYDTPLPLRGKRGITDINATFFNAGHILGSAGILFEVGGKNIFHTGDVQFHNQAVLTKAKFPRHHLDVLICESTNGLSDEDTPEFNKEKQNLAQFINAITTNGGSVLIPSFSLGKTQEILTILYQLMKKTTIPTLPIYTGGISKKVSNLYDRYCYDGGRVNKGFEIADIPQNPINHEELMTGPYFSTPSIVVASSGMMNPGTTSYKLAAKWLDKGNFGIAFVGYQDEDAPGHALLNSEHKKPFLFSGTQRTRKCQVGKFRFSAHANRAELVDFILGASPKELYLIHGDDDACSSLALTVMEFLPHTKVVIPRLGKTYQLLVEKDS